MDSKWMCFLLLDLTVLTCSIPGRFYHDFHHPQHNHNHGGHGQQWGHDWGSQGWGHRWENGWFSGTRRTKGTTAKPTEANPAVTQAKGIADTTEGFNQVQTSTPIPTLPQPVINDTDIRFGEIATSDSSRLTFIPVAPSTKNIEQAIQPVFTTGPEDENIDTGSSSVMSDETIGSGSDIEASKINQIAGQWHVGIYKNKGKSYELICGGSFLRTTLVISAGLCFWSSEGQLPANQFAAAAGKRYPRWKDPRETEAQYADVKDITITTMPRPCLQPDLAFVTLLLPIGITEGVKPVCINFNEDQILSLGTVPSWSKFEDGACKPSGPLHWMSLPYIDRQACNANESLDARQMDRICAGEINNNTQCATDIGSGLVFYQNEVPYLRGVATFTSNHQCYKYTTRSFTDLNVKINTNSVIIDILKHLSEFNCEEFYKNSTFLHDPLGFGPIQEEIDDDVGVFKAQGTLSIPVPKLTGTNNAPAFQWHVGVYSKSWTPYMQICGGSLVKRDFVISAAHCFWDDETGQQPASQFAVAGGKMFRPWNDTLDSYAQKSDVSQIILPIRFRGSATSFQDDIAILRLTTAFTYAPGVQSVCVDFNILFDREQLRPGNLGTVAGWGLTEENGSPSQRLNYLELPYVDVAECIASSQPTFLKYITSDKVCAGDTFTGKALCRGDSGGGLVLFSNSTPYLRGVASTAAGNTNLCNAFAIAAFTQINAHRTFLRDNIPGVDTECSGNARGTTDQDRIVGLVGTMWSTGAVGNIAIPSAAGNAGRIGNGGKDMPAPVTAPYNNHFVCNCNCRP